MKCKKCGEKFSQYIRIKDKNHNLQNRKFCLSCSPFGKHNTKDITKECKVDGNKVCNSCGSKFNENQLTGYKCWNCLNKQAKTKNRDKLYELMGDKCCLCGYNRCRAAMDFHHMDREKKSHGLSQREMTYAWERIVAESKKCVLLCAVCHREYHSGFISQEVMNEAYNKTH